MRSNLFGRLSLLFLFIQGQASIAQQINAEVFLNTDQINQTNIQQFQNLQSSLQSFLNSTNWSSEVYPEQSRLNIRYYFIVNAYENDTYQCTLQMSYNRPVYNTSYQSPLLLINDPSVNFKYEMGTPLALNLNALNSNLVSLVSYYTFLALGFHADSFALNGGSAYFESAHQIAVQMSSNTAFSWPKSRTDYANDILNNAFDNFRRLYYEYHINGIDVLEADFEQGQSSIYESLLSIENLSRQRGNAVLLRMLFDAKADEISALFFNDKTEPQKLERLTKILNKVAPYYTSKWTTSN